MRRLNAAPIVDIKECYDADVTCLCVSSILISPHTDLCARHLFQSQTCLHMTYEMSSVFTQPESFRVILQVSIAYTIIQDAGSQEHIKRLRRAAHLQRRLQQMCCDVRDGTVPGTLHALRRCIRL